MFKNFLKKKLHPSVLYLVLLGSIVIFSSGLNYSISSLNKFTIEGTQTFIKKLPDNAPTTYMIGEIVTFELKIACSSLTTGCGDATITDIIPDGLEYVNAGYPIGTTGNYDENTRTFTATSLNLDGGDTRIITITCRVATDAIPGSQITNEACSNITNPSSTSNANICSSAEIDIANLPFNPDWEVRKTRLGPTIVLDQPVTYRVQLCSNQAILNPNLENATLIDVLPSGVIVNSSEGGIYDSQDNTITWNLGDISIGELYGDNASDEVMCVSRTLSIVYPSSTFSTGDFVTNEVLGTGNFSPSGGNFSDAAQRTDEIVLPEPIAALSKSIGSTVEAGGIAEFRINFRNTGNIPLENYQVTDIWTHNYELNSIQTPRVNTHEYILETSIDGGTSWTVHGVYEDNVVVNFAANNQINGVRLTPFDDGNSAPPNFLAVGARMTSNEAMRIRFQIPEGASGSIENCISDSADNSTFSQNINQCDSASIIEPVADVPQPNISKRITPTSINPGEEFVIRLDRFSNSGTTECVANPIIADLLPVEMEFISFKEFKRGSKNSNAPAPTFELIENYNNTGRTLVRFSWGDNPPSNALNTNGEPAVPNPYCINGYGNNNNERMWIEFVAGLKPGVLSGTYQNTACIFASEGNCENTAIDTNDLDGDNNSTESICECDDANITLIGGAGIKGQKWVRGASQLGIEDDPSSTPETPDAFCPTTADGFTRFPCIANSFQNGILDFRLVAINQGDAPLKDFVLYDVLPHPNDSGVSEGLSTVQRLSNWQPRLIGIEANNALTQGSGYVLEYSTNVNAARPEISDNMDETGWQTNPVDDWTTTPPSPIELVRAIKISVPFSDATPWQPGDSLIFDVKMQIPLTVDFNTIAWNSFAYRGTNANNNSRLLTAEPRKAGIQIPPSGEIDCFLNIDNYSQSTCNNNVTPDFVADDYFTISLSASAFNFGPSEQYEMVINALSDGTGGTVLGTANYGQSLTVGDGNNGATGTFRANDITVYELTVRDKDSPICFDRITTIPVSSCFEQVNCDIQVTLGAPVYNDNQTPSNISDDTFTFTATVTGQGTAGWTGGGQSGSFGETRTYGPYPVDSEGAVFPIYDSTNTRCAVSIGVNMSSCIYLGTCTCCTSD